MGLTDTITLGVDFWCTSFILPLNQLVISVKEADGGNHSFGSLTDSWIILDDVSSRMRSSPTMLAFGELIGGTH